LLLVADKVVGSCNFANDLDFIMILLCLSYSLPLSLFGTNMVLLLNFARLLSLDANSKLFLINTCELTWPKCYSFLSKLSSTSKSAEDVMEVLNLLAGSKSDRSSYLSSSNFSSPCFYSIDGKYIFSLLDTRSE